MNKLFTKAIGVALGLTMAIGVGVAVAGQQKGFRETSAAASYTFTSDTLTFANQGLENGVQYSDPFTNNKFSVQFAGGANDGKYYTTGTGMRTYGGGSFTVAGITGNVTGITFTWDGSNKPTTTDVASVGTLSNDSTTWSGDAAEVTFTRPSGSGHWRLKTVTATVASSGVASINLSKNSVKFLTEGAAQTITATPINFSDTPVISVEGTPSYVNTSVSGTTVTLSPKAVGTEKITIKAAGATQQATAEVDVVVKNKHGYLENDPFTVAEARAELDADSIGNDSVYITGIISQIDSYNNNQITYWISDDGTTTNQFEVYKGKGLNNQNFNSIGDIGLGATVEVFGTVKIYGTIYEFNAGNYLVSYAEPAKTLVSIELSNETTVFTVGDAFVKATVTANYSNSSTADVTDDAVFTGYNMAEAGNYTVNVSYTESEVIKEASYEITVYDVIPTVNYKKVKTNLANFSGDYLIVYEDETNYAFDGSLNTLDASSNTVEVTISSEVINSQEAYEFHIAAKEGGYSLQSASSFYIGKTANSNGLDSNASDNYTNTISYEDDVMNVVGSGKAVLRYNKTSGQERFRFFKTESYAGQQEISLYMQVTDAEALALDILNETAETCDAWTQETDVSGYTARKTALATIWSNLKTKYSSVDMDDLKDVVAKKDGVMVEEAMARYELLTAKYELENFISSRTPHANSFSQSFEANNDTIMIIVVIIAAMSALSMVTFLTIKRRKHN